jgi:ABC-type Fe2+-enterobactin transport system substrate-binding protein
MWLKESLPPSNHQKLGSAICAPTPTIDTKTFFEDLIDLDCEELFAGFNANTDFLLYSDHHKLQL